MSTATIPDEFLCPITKSVMKDPVIGPDGQTYERPAIEQWLQGHHDSPITRIPMMASQLVPNYALKNMIQSFLLANVDETQSAATTTATRAHAGVAAGASAASARLGVELGLVARVHKKIDGSKFAHVKISPPAAGPKRPLQLICVLDVSGSMDTDASIQSSKESDQLTRLDIVKHSVNTIIETLDDEDSLAIVKFSSDAQVVLPMMRVQGNGKARAKQALMALQTEGSTNIWDGLRVSLELASRTASVAALPCTIVMFTDGESNMDPPRGIVPTLESCLAEHKFDGSLHTFGFGYDLDSQLLSNIAHLGGGTFGYIPDSSMVGTVFVNFASTALATYSQGLRLTAGSADGASPSDQEFYVSMVQYGQSRDLFVPIGEHASQVQLTLADLHGFSKCICIDANNFSSVQGDAHGDGISAEMDENSNGFVSQKARMLFIDRVSRAIPNMDAASVELPLLVSELKALGGPADHFLRDVESSKAGEGQVKKAFERQDWYARWGRHYLPSLVRSHELQQRLNFRDPSVQLYGGDAFVQYQAKADKLFCALPPPQSSARAGADYRGSGAPSSRVPVNMSSYYNSRGPCFDGDSLVAMFDGTVKRVRDLRKGDVLSNGGRVRCLVETVLGDEPTRVINLKGMWITPWHPVIWNGAWTFPNEVDPSAVVDKVLGSIFNLVLESVHVAEICGVQVICLGHGMQGPVIGHAYFGTDAVIEDLQHVENWETGHILLDSGCMVRNPETQLVTGIISHPPAPALCEAFASLQNGLSAQELKVN
eukprot:ANDGO_06983.mRNA.1 Protein spotted leaf 11